MPKAPAFQFYTGDWMKDPNLSMCMPATRGIFIDLLCAMHETDRSGRLSGTVEQLARLARCTPSEMTDALAEISETDTAEVSRVTVGNGSVTVTNRRMRREWRERKSNAERQKRHKSRSGNAKSDVKDNASVTKKSRSLSSSSSSASATTEASPPAQSAPKSRPLTDHQKKIKSALELWDDVPDGLRPAPALVASWFKDWEDDAALLRNLRELQAMNAFSRGVPFVISMLGVRFQNGKKAPPPLRETKASPQSRQQRGDTDLADLRAKVRVHDPDAAEVADA